MCGIVGFITTESKTGEMARSKFLKQALIIDTLRGDDSCGVFTVGHEPQYEDGTAWYLKQVGTGQEFVDTKDYWTNLYDVDKYRCVVGHNRAATVGGVSTDTAHPFQVGNITLVHNGTLTSANVLPSPMSSIDGITVDSHAIAHNLNEHSVADVVENLYGAFALVWHDARDDSVNVVRNTKRPLHFAMGQDGKTLFFMSEGEMLHLLDKRLNLKMKQVYFPEEGQHLKWLPDSPLDTPEVQALDLYEDKWPTYDSTWKQQHQTGAYGGYDDSWHGYGTYEDTEDDVFPKRQAQLPGADHVFVGGRRREVPMIVQEAMLTYDVVVEDRLRFTPRSYQPSARSPGASVVTGKLAGGHQAVIYSCQSQTVGQRMNQDWTVRVIGVKIAISGEPWFICKMVCTFCSDELLTGKTKRTGYQVPGYNGVYVGIDDFTAQTVDGCVMCYHNLIMSDAHDIVWVKEGAICPSCDEHEYVAPEVKDVKIIH